MRDHIHKFKRIILGNTKIVLENGKKHIKKTGEGKVFYRCMIPGCQRLLPKELMENQVSECWRCGDTMIIGVSDLQGFGKVHPVHHECRRPKNSNLTKGDNDYDGSSDKSQANQ